MTDEKETLGTAAEGLQPHDPTESAVAHCTTGGRLREGTQDNVHPFKRRMHRHLPPEPPRSSSNSDHPMIRRMREKGHLPPAPERSVLPPPLPGGGRGDRSSDLYWQSALEREIQIVAAAPEGIRNHQLNKSAFKLAGIVRSGHLHRDVVADGLRQAAAACGLPAGEAEKTIRSAFSGAENKRITREKPPLEEVAPAFTVDPAGQGGRGGSASSGAGQTSGVDREVLIEFQLDRLRIAAEAKRRLDAEDRPPISLPPVRSLAALLAEPLPVVRYRVEQCQPAGSRVLLAAQYKAGKTTLSGNLTRSLVDGDPFLGRFAMAAGGARVALIDNELSPRMVQDWMGEHAIRNTDDVVDVATLRGSVGSFDLLDDQCRTRWAERFAGLGVDYLIVDCLRPILDALGLDEHREAGRFLVAFDALLSEAGIADALLVHHMGHGSERSRGDSRLQDWPDAIWRIVREGDDPAGPRFFSAFGRDVDVAEGGLTFSPAGRRLTLAGGSRTDAKAEAAMPDVLDALAAHALAGGDGLSTRQIEDELSGGEHGQKAIRAARKLLVARELVTVTPGAGRSHLHRIANPCRGCGKPVAAQGSLHQSCGEATT